MSIICCYIAICLSLPRLLKRLKTKGRKQIELERKEQGFALYLNGANAAAGHIKSEHTANHSHHRKTEFVEQQESHHRYRAKSAPEKNRRKLWIAESLDIQTSRGEKIRIRAPGKLLINFLLCVCSECE